MAKHKGETMGATAGGTGPSGSTKAAPRGAATAAPRNRDGHLVGSGTVHGDVDAGTPAPIDRSLVAVKLTKGYSPFNAGEVAGFPEAEAKRLVETGYGEYHTAADTEKAEDELRERSQRHEARRTARETAATSRREAREEHQTGAQKRGKGKAGKKGAKKPAIIPGKKAKGRGVKK